MDLAFLENLKEAIGNYHCNDKYQTVFKVISNTYYRENYHSDLLAYYLNFKEIKKLFIKFLNECYKRDDKDKEIVYSDYEKGPVVREEKRIDILIYSPNKGKAILIENKSNNAKDQYRQLYKYYSKLKEKGTDVEAIFYLNKNSLNPPNLSNLETQEKNAIKKLLVIGQLVGKDSFTEKVLKIAADTANDIRLKALSQEIENLFFTIIYGDIKMGTLERFETELLKNDNLAKLKEAIRTYDYMPNYFADKYHNKYSSSLSKKYKIWLYRANILVIDIKKDDVNYAIDIEFDINYVKFSIFMREGKEQLLERLKDMAESKKEFPFDSKEMNRYTTKIPDLFAAQEIENKFNEIFSMMNKYLLQRNVSIAKSAKPCIPKRLQGKQNRGKNRGYKCRTATNK